MAINPNYTHDTVLSKVKIGENVYYLKDADLRAIVAQFGNATAQDVAASIGENVPGLATGIQVYEYVNQKTADIAGAMHFVAGTRAQQTDPKAGDVVVEGVIEYVYDGTAWQELGDEGTWIPKSREIAGINLEDDVTAAELKLALSLAALAYANTASATVDDYVTGINGATYTPAGSVSITADTEAAASYDKTTSVSVTTAVAAEGTDGNYTPAGDITITPSKTSVATVTDQGTAYQLNGGSATKAADTTGTFATEGVVASVGTGDDAETLILTAAGTSAAVTASGDVSYTAPTLTGSLPTFGSQSVVDGITNSVFNGTAVNITAAPAHTSTAATVTQPTFTASFTGTEDTIAPTLVKGSKKITVTPDAIE